MKDWKERVEAMEATLADWNRRYEAELARIHRAKGRRGWFRKPSEEELAAFADEASRAVGEDTLREYYALCDAIVAHYLGKAGVQERGEIRARVGLHPTYFDYFWGYVEWCIDRVEGGGEEEVRAAVGAFSVDDGRVDYEQMQRSFARLWIAAARRGVDPAPIVAEVAAVSNRGSGGGAPQLRGFLQGFQGSAYFASKVEPALRDRARAS